MGRLDDAIENVAYILDTLIAYRRISEQQCCNTCSELKECAFRPKPGEPVRINCPFYRGEVSNSGKSI